MATNPFRPPSSFQRKLACMDAGGRAASGTSRRGIQEGEAAVVKGWQGSSDARVRLSLLLSFPRRGNGWSKSLNSGLRRNDGGARLDSGVCRTAMGILDCLLPTPLYHLCPFRHIHIMTARRQTCSAAQAPATRASRLRTGCRTRPARTQAALAALFRLQ